jgi:hypothetical protein
VGEGSAVLQLLDVLGQWGRRGEGGEGEPGGKRRYIYLIYIERVTDIIEREREREYILII